MIHQITNKYRKFMKANNIQNKMDLFKIMNKKDNKIINNLIL